MKHLRASIIISSYNYDRFLAVAIDSALAQTYPDTEVIVVDDGSRDRSPEIIKSYGDRIIAILKANGGQASAFNEGFKRSSGDVIIFLDSDDYLLPDTVEKAVELFSDPTVAKVHWNLSVGDDTGAMSEGTVRHNLPEGDLRETVLRKGPDGYTWPPTSGNGWARRYLEAALPIPESEFDTCPDLYLATLAPLYGTVKAIHKSQGFWRYHPQNASFRDAFGHNMNGGLRRAERALQCLETHARSLGLEVNPEEVRWNSRWHQMASAVEQITEIIPPDESLILIDEDHWNAGNTIAGRKRFYFVEADGKFWGLPENDAAAIAELERLRGEGAGFLVLPWPYGWWLDHYAGFNGYLRSKYKVARENQRIVIFDLH